MTLRSLLVGGALALGGARALLVVPEIDADSVGFPGDISRLHPLEAQAAQQQQVDLLCNECPFAIQSGDETSLSLKFSIEDGLLLANGRQIFPPAPPTLITAVQHRLYDGEESEPVPLGYAVEMMPLPSPRDEPLDMIAVRFTVLDLDGYPVPLDTVAITLIHDGSGDIYMAKTNIEESADRGSWRKCGGKPKCLRRFMAHRIHSLFAAAKERLLSMIKGTGCAGAAAPPFPPRPHHDELDVDRFPFSGPEGTELSWADHETERPGHHRPHGHPHHHHFHDSYRGNWHRTLHRVVRFILVPAVLGVLAGLAASALGMLVGQVVVFLWQRHRSRSSSIRIHDVQGSDDEKQGLMVETHGDLPPAYCDEEAAAEEVADKN